MYRTDKKEPTVRISARASWCASRITRKYYIYVRGATWGGQDVGGRGRGRSARERNEEEEREVRRARGRRRRRRTRRSTCDLRERGSHSNAPTRKISKIVPADWLPADPTRRNPRWTTVRSDMSENRPIGSALVSSPGLLGPLTGQPRWSHSPIRDRDRVNPVGTGRGGKDTYGGYCSSNVTFPTGSRSRVARKEKDIFKAAAQDVSLSRYFLRVSQHAAALR